LSGGEQQMLAISRGLMSSPKLMLLDEPSLGLAPQLVKVIFNTIEEINRQGVTLFLVEQNAHMALKVAQKGYVLEKGNVIIQDSCEALLADEKVQKAYLGMD
ncbi:MAG: ATP-binding cassette domain-containing protein, partial [Deltaproteobacteria bacterium]|nr:ATP-binding cassette domain-containing protein [Deltaproteobacteria bacterium]